MAAKKALLVAYGGGHITMIVPVARELAAQGVEVTILALTTARPAALASGFPVLGFADVLDPERDEAALVWGRKLAGELDRSSVVAAEETVAYLGLSYADLVERLGPEAAQSAYQRLGRQCFLPVTVLERFLDRLQPDVVVATTAPRAERAALMAAGRQGIPSVCISGLFAIQEAPGLVAADFITRICVLADGVRDRLVQAGRPEADLVVTGNPAFDVLAERRDSFDRRAWRAGRGWAETDRVILWASQPEPRIHPFTGAAGEPELPRRVDRALLEALPSHPEWRLVFRAHPSETHAWEDLPGRVEVSGRSDDLTALLLGADCVLTMSSTVGLEAALVGTPVVQLQCSIFSADAPYAAMGLARAAATPPDVPRALEQVWSDTGWRVAGLPSVGGSARRVASVITSLL